MLFGQQHKIVPVLFPVADAFAGTVNTDVVSLKNYNHVTFFLIKGIGATGTTVVKMQATDDFVPTTTADIAFRQANSKTVDTFVDFAEVTSSGVTVTAGSNEIWLFEADADEVQADSTAFTAVGVRLNMVEGVNSPITGMVGAIGSEVRFRGNASELLSFLS